MPAARDTRDRISGAARHARDNPWAAWSHRRARRIEAATGVGGGVLGALFLHAHRFFVRLPGYRDATAGDDCRHVRARRSDRWRRSLSQQTLVVMGWRWDEVQPSAMNDRAKRPGSDRQPGRRATRRVGFSSKTARRFLAVLPGPSPGDGSMRCAVEPKKGDVRFVQACKKARLLTRRTSEGPRSSRSS